MTMNATQDVTSSCLSTVTIASIVLQAISDPHRTYTVCQAQQHGPEPVNNGASGVPRELPRISEPTTTITHHPSPSNGLLD
jgi:hypothetical protein